MTANEYVYQTMLTCIGNKRKLVSKIEEVVLDVSKKINKTRLNIVDGFSGSSVVSRQFSYISNKLYSNDLEYYAFLMSKCYLETPSVEQRTMIHQHINAMNTLAENGPYVEGIISKLYAPKDTQNVCEGERCFYTRENALIIDTLREYISNNVEDDIYVYCLVPLLNKASIHTNTAGVFKGFYKKNNIGCFGGSGEVALSRIMKPIRVEAPIWNTTHSFVPVCSNSDINALMKELPDDIDLIYLDPPYNQHPYGSNYFMLNVIATNKEPTSISKVSGIPTDWKKSNYNTRKAAVESMRELLVLGLQKSKYILISYNNEGIISANEWDKLFGGYKVTKYEFTYDAYKGSRNLKKRNNKVVEIMYLVSRGDVEIPGQ